MVSLAAISAEWTATSSYARPIKVLHSDGTVVNLSVDFLFHDFLLSYSLRRNSRPNLLLRSVHDDDDSTASSSESMFAFASISSAM